MKNFISRYLLAVVYGVAIPAIPYGSFVYLIHTIGEERFNLHPHFIAVILGITLLILGAYSSGKYLGKIYGSYSLVLVSLSTPGLYIGLGGIVISVIVDGGLSDSLATPLIIVTLILFSVSVPFSLLGYRKAKRT